MPALSKNSPPSLTYSCIKLVFTFPMFKQNSRFLKQSQHNLNGVVSGIHKGDNLSVYPHQKMSKVPISSSFLKFDNCKELEFSMSAYGILIIAVICNYLQKFHDEMVLIAVLGLLKQSREALKPKILGPFVLLKPLEMKRFLKYLEHFCKSPEFPMILGLFCGLLHIQTVFAKDLEHFHMSPEVISILETSCSPKLLKIMVEDFEYIQKFPGKPEILDQFYLRMPCDMKLCERYSDQFPQLPETQESRKTLQVQKQLKLQGMCYSCEEKISQKKFFDERRFGILNNCDCLICYGCLRKTARSSGVVWGPVICPSCSVKSDKVAASSRWIGGKEKLNFFGFLPELLRMKLNMPELSIMSPNPISCLESETVKVPSPCPLHLDIVSANESFTAAKETLESFDLLQIKESPNAKLDLAQTRDVSQSLNPMDFCKSKVVTEPLIRNFMLDTVATNASYIEGKKELEFCGYLQKHHATTKMELDFASKDYISARLPMLGLVN